MVLIFDLDDTLYDESTYVESGFRAVAEHAEREHGWDARASLATMMEILARDGRGAVFDRWLEGHGARTSALVSDCIRVYRHHHPSIRLWVSADRLLESLSADHRLYIVTDGHKVAQARKVEALGLAARLQKAYITHRYGVRHAKPSTYCFELIRRREGCAWTDMLYAGDNPAKDFVNLNPLGVRTVRVMTGMHRNVLAAPGYDAHHRVPDLDHFEPLLETLQR
jgi:putative hydrolase of the HAD superfamily